MIQNSDIDSKLVVAIHYSHFDPGHTALIYIPYSFRKTKVMKNNFIDMVGTFFITLGHLAYLALFFRSSIFLRLLDM